VPLDHFSPLSDESIMPSERRSGTFGLTCSFKGASIRGVLPRRTSRLRRRALTCVRARYTREARHIAEVQVDLEWILISKPWVHMSSRNCL